jgi:hypothetical protein
MDKGLDRNVSTFQDAVMDFTLSDNQALFIGPEDKVAQQRKIQVQRCF